MTTHQQEQREDKPQQDKPIEDKNNFKEWIGSHAMLFAGLTAVLLVLFVVQSIRIAVLGSQHRSEVASMREEQAKDLDEVRTSASASLATTLGASLHQLFVMRSQFPEISDRTFQAVATEMANTGDYALIVVADSSGTIIASSDLTIVGTQISQLPKSDSPFVAESAIQDVNAELGKVRIEVQPETLTPDGR